MPKRDETLTLSVGWKNAQRATSTITIVDQSYPKEYNTRFSSNSSGSNTITSANEGTTVYFIIETENIDNGTVLRVVTTANGSGANTATSNDFNNYVANQNVTINNNKGYISLDLKADNITEGAESFTCTLTTSTGTTLSSSTLTINDTSQTPDPTYSYGWFSTSAGTTSISSINEGSTAWFVVNTTNLPNGTVLTVNLSGISGSDVSDGVLQKDITIQSNTGRVSFAITNDNLTEGTETIVGRLSRGSTVIGTRNLIINDTSQTPNPTYSVMWSGNSNGSGTISSVNEGGTAYLVVKTTNVANNTNLSYTLSGTGINSGDTSQALTGTITINNNIGFITVPITNDSNTEGNETMTGTVRNGTTVVGSANITINDTSKTPTPTYNVAFYASSDGTGSTNYARPGDRTHLIFRTTNVPNGTVMTVKWVGGALGTTDFVGLSSLTSTVTIQNNYAILSYQFANNASASTHLEVQISGSNGYSNVIIFTLDQTGNGGGGSWVDM